MNLSFYPCDINYKEGSFTLGKQMQIASFTVPEDPFYTHHLDAQYRIPSSAAEILHNILENKDMIWVVEQSYGGVYVQSDVIPRTDRLDVLHEVQVYVYVSEEIYTFCQLKYSEMLTKIINGV